MVLFSVAENIANRSLLSLEGTWLFYAIWPILLPRTQSRTRQDVYFNFNVLLYF